MSESLSKEELAELIRSGRINTSKSATKRRQKTRTTSSSNNMNSDNSKPSTIRTRISDATDSLPRLVNLPTKSEVVRDPDVEWLRAEKEKAERNIASPRQDKKRQEDMEEASRF